MKHTRTSITIEQEILKKIEKYAKKKHLNLSQAVEQLVIRGLK